jgi:hypothetical protein
MNNWARIRLAIVFALGLYALGLATAPARLAAQAPLTDLSPAIDAEGAFLDDDLPLSGLAQRLRQLEDNQQRLEGLLGPPPGQDSPAASLDDGDEPLPDYVFSPSYYNDLDVGARAIADYAPPGYEARDQQEGPAELEYDRIDAPEELTAEEREKFVTRGLFPGSFLAPGTNTSVRLGGFVRLAGLFDFTPIGVPDAFVTNSIPAPQQSGQNFNASGRISRFNLETWTPTSFRDWNVHTFIEGDFFNGVGQAAGGGGNPFRLRHAFFDFGYFRFGQQNTVFMDASSWPSLVDFQGPNSWVNQRQPSMRMTLPLFGRWYWATSIERPFSDITARDAGGASLGDNVQDIPDFATHLRFDGDRGHLQIAGLLRTIKFRPTGGDVQDLTASGISGTAVLHPWAILTGANPLYDRSACARSRLLMQGTWGSGVGRYFNDLAGQGLDATVDPVTGDFELADASGWNASYEQWFNEQWLMNFTYAAVDVDTQANLAATTYNSANYTAASLWWIPVPRLSLAVEYITGERENLDGQSGRAERLHGLAQYNF